MILILSYFIYPSNLYVQRFEICSYVFNINLSPINDFVGFVMPLTQQGTGGIIYVFGLSIRLSVDLYGNFITVKFQETLGGFSSYLAHASWRVDLGEIRPRSKVNELSLIMLYFTSLSQEPVGEFSSYLAHAPWRVEELIRQWSKKINIFTSLLKYLENIPG